MTRNLLIRFSRPSLLAFADAPTFLNRFASTVESTFKLHGFLHVQENARAKSFLLRSRRGAVAEYARIVSSSLDLAPFPLALGLQKVLPTRETLRCEQLKFGSSGRIRTYDQSVNPDCVGTLPLSYDSKFSNRVRIRRADFHDLI